MGGRQVPKDFIVALYFSLFGRLSVGGFFKRTLYRLPPSWEQLRGSSAADAAEGVQLTLFHPAHLSLWALPGAPPFFSPTFRCHAFPYFAHLRAPGRAMLDPVSAAVWILRIWENPEYQMCEMRRWGFLPSSGELRGSAGPRPLGEHWRNSGLPDGIAKRRTSN